MAENPYKLGGMPAEPQARLVRAQVDPYQEIVVSTLRVWGPVRAQRRLASFVYDDAKRALRDAGVIACANGRWYLRQGWQESLVQARRAIALTQA